MPKKPHRKKPALPEETPAPPVSSRFRFFLWVSAFFFGAALLLRLDVITVWTGAEGYALDHALSNNRGESILSFLNGVLVGKGEGFSATQSSWLFPRLLSAAAVLATAFFTYRWAGRLFGVATVTLGLLCAGASLFLPFFGKVATPDALALLGQSSFLWLTLLAGADRGNNYLLPAGIFLLVGGIAAPFSTLAFGLATILAGRLLFGGGKQWTNMLVLLAIPLVVWLLQGGQGERSYWFWGNHPFAYGRLLLYCTLGMLPVIGWLAGGVRDLVYKVQRGELRGRLLGAGLAIGFVTQSLVFPLLLALLAGMQMQGYFSAANYPWRNWVRGAAVLQLIFAFLAVFFVLAGAGLTFSANGYRAALGAAAGYWIFSLLGVVGLYGDRRDFAIGGTVLAGLLGMLFFWGQVYPFLEIERDWPERLVGRIEVPLPTYVPAKDDYSPMLPYLRGAGIPLVTDSTAADLLLKSWQPGDTLTTAAIEVDGRTVLKRRVFGLGTQ